MPCTVRVADTLPLAVNFNVKTPIVCNSRFYFPKLSRQDVLGGTIFSARGPSCRYKSPLNTILGCPGVQESLTVFHWAAKFIFNPGLSLFATAEDLLDLYFPKLNTANVNVSIIHLLCSKGTTEQKVPASLKDSVHLRIMLAAMPCKATPKNSRAHFNVLWAAISGAKTQHQLAGDFAKSAASGPIGCIVAQ
jgi:hypothetical protein